MELWIRNQDKTVLSKIDNIMIDDNDYVLYCQISYGQIALGEYKTKERALEVLDEIQNILKPQMILSRPGKPIAETCDGLVYTTPNEYEIKEISTYVYEMPEE